MHEPDLHLADGLAPGTLAAPAHAAVRGREVVLVEGARERVLHSSSPPQGQLAWSPRGEVLYLCADSQLLSLDPDSGQARPLAGLPRAHRPGYLLGLSEEGQLVFLSQSHRLCQVDPRGKNFSVLLEADFSEAVCLSSGLVVCDRWDEAEGSHQLTLFDLKGRRPTRLARSTPPRWDQYMEVSLSAGGTHVAIRSCEGLSIRRVERGSLGAALLELADDPGPDSDFYHALRWSPVEGRLAFMRMDSELWEARPGAPARRLVWLEGELPHQRRPFGPRTATPAWSNDGRHLWFRLTWSHPEDIFRPEHPELCPFRTTDYCGLVDFELGRVDLAPGRDDEVVFRPR